MTETPIPYDAGPPPIFTSGAKVVHQITKEQGIVLEVLFVHIGTDVTEGLLMFCQLSGCKSSGLV